MRAAAPTESTSTAANSNTNAPAAPVPGSLGTMAGIVKAARALGMAGTAYFGEGMTMLDEKINDLLRYANRHELVGSRVTCNPPPADMDQDVLVYVDSENADYFVSKMKQAGFSVELGEGYAEDALNGGQSDRFQSYRQGDVNLIVTIDQLFYQRFAYATEIAKRANLMLKDERVELFQAILYGNMPPSPEYEYAPKKTTIHAPQPFAFSPPPKDFMRPWWVSAEGVGSGCVEALNEAAARSAGTNLLGADVDKCEVLPYPAEPRLNKYDGPQGVCPSFCYSPNTCKGRGCCPQSPSCVD